MTHGLCRPALAVELAFDFRAFEHDLTRYPRGFGDLGRVFFHELLHCWQVLSQSYLTKLAAAEFEQLTFFRETGRLPERAGGEDLEGRFLAKHPAIGISANQLSEALCRFWDVEVTGPDIVYQASTGQPLPLDPARRALVDPLSGSAAFSARDYETAMLAEDVYADPYRLAIDRWGDEAPIIFPLIAHFSLQTDYPIDVFAAALRKAEVVLGRRPAVSALEPPWFRAWEAAQHVVVLTARAFGIDLCQSGMDAIQQTILIDHQIFRHYVGLMEIARSTWGEDYFEYAFAAPGRERGALSTFFHPSVTLLRGGRWPNAAPAEIDLMTAIAPGQVESHLTSMANIGQSTVEDQRQLRVARLLSRKRDALAGTVPVAPAERFLLPPTSHGLELAGIEIRQGRAPRPPRRRLGRWRVDTDRRDVVAAAWSWLVEQLWPELQVAELLTESPVPLPEDASELVRVAAAELSQHLAASDTDLPLEAVLLNLRYMPDRTLARDLGPYALSGTLKETTKGPIRVKMTAGLFRPLAPGSQSDTGRPVLRGSILLRHDEQGRADLQAYLDERFRTAAPRIRSEPLIGQKA